MQQLLTYIGWNCSVQTPNCQICQSEPNRCSWHSSHLTFHCLFLFPPPSLTHFPSAHRSVVYILSTISLSPSLTLKFNFNLFINYNGEHGSNNNPLELWMSYLKTNYIRGIGERYSSPLRWQFDDSSNNLSRLLTKNDLSVACWFTVHRMQIVEAAKFLAAGTVKAFEFSEIKTLKKNWGDVFACKAFLKG